MLLIAALAGGAAYAFSASQEKEYRATTEFAFGRTASPELNALGPDFSEPSIDEAVRIATEAERLDSFDVAAATARTNPELGLAAGAVNRRVTAEPDRGSLVVVVTSTGTTPARAARLGRAYTQTYLRLLRDDERERALEVEQALQRRLSELPQSSRVGPLGASIRDQLSVIGVLRRVGSGSPDVIQNARSSAIAAQPQTKRNVLFGVLFGLVAGVGLVALRADGRIRTAVGSGRGIPRPGGDRTAA